MELGGDPLILLFPQVPLLSRALFNGTPPSRHMKSPQSAYLKSRAVILHFSLSQSLHNTELSYDGHCSQGCLLPSQSESSFCS